MKDHFDKNVTAVNQSTTSRKLYIEQNHSPLKIDIPVLSTENTSPNGRTKFFNDL